MGYITIANSKRMIRKLDSEKLKEFQGEIYKRPIYFFNQREKSILLAFRALLKDPNNFLIEYYAKIELGYTINYNTFFSFYWMLTLFHVIHVLTGIVILFFTQRDLKKNKTAANLENFEASATFWHMCDLIWLLLFPVIYLIF